MHRSPIVAAVAATTFEIALVAMVGHPLGAAYVLACALLSLAAAVALAQLGRMGLGEPSSLALWAGLHGFLLSQGSPSSAALIGAVLLGVTWLAARPLAGRPFVAGGSAALGVGAAFAIWPRIAPDLGFPESDAFAFQALAVGLFAAPMLGAALAQRLAWLRPRLAPLLAAGLVGACLLPLVGGRGTTPLPSYAPAPVPLPGPSMLVLILDTVRADHLSIYGHERETTPALARFLERHPRARLYPLAYATGTWTLPSHASLFTGTLPSQHGVHSESAFLEGGIAQTELLAEVTLAEALRARGYRTACIFANSWLQHVSGLERGFDWFVRPLGFEPLPLLGEALRERLLPGTFVKEAAGSLTAGLVNRQVLRFLDRCGSAACYVVANYMEAHAPLMPPRHTAGLFAAERRPFTSAPKIADPPEKLRYLAAVYDEEIRGLDAALGELLAALEARGILDESWLVITSDHGEGFGEHGATEHGTTVHAEVTRIPLLILPPKGVELPAEDGAAGLLDVATTLAAVGGVPGFGAGSDLRVAAPERAVPVEFFGNARKARNHGPLAGLPARAVLQEGWRLIEHDGRRELYQVERDPEERFDLSENDPERVEALSRLLPPLEDATGGAPARELELSPAEREQLRVLGYIE